MKQTKFWGIAPALVLSLVLAAAPVEAAEHRLGLGAHLWKPAADLFDDSFESDESDLAALVSYQFVPFQALKLQADLEYFPNGFGGAGEEAWSPQALIVLGDRWYVAAGAGTVYSSAFEGDFSNTFYIARLGVDYPLLPRLRLDVSADTRAAEPGDLADVDEETITFAAALRFRL